MLKKSQRIKQRISRAPHLFALVCIAVLISILLLANYLTQRSLQQANIFRFQQELKERAITISYFFSERKCDIRELAVSKSVTGFFSNKDLGMTMGYGLRASLNNISRLFKRRMESSRLGEKAIFTHLVLLDTNGKVLSRMPFIDLPEFQPVPDDVGTADVIVRSHGSGVVSFTAPVFTHDKLQGFLRGWVSYDTLVGYLVNGRNLGLLFITDQQRLVFQSPMDFVIRPAALKSLHSQESSWPLEIRKQSLIESTGNSSGNENLTLFYAEIPDFPIALYLAKESSSVNQRQSFLFVMAVLVVLSVTVFWIVKAAMAEVARQKEYIENLFDVVPEGLLAIGPSMEIVKSNQVFTDLIEIWAERFALSPEKLTGKFLVELQEALQQTSQFIFALSHNSRTAYFRYNTTLIPSLDGVEHVVSIRDITSERKAEAAGKLLATVIEQTVDSIIITETDGTITYVNPATVAISGYSREELLGKTPAIFKSGQTDKAVYSKLWQTISRGEIWNGQLVNKRKDGTFIEENATISPVRNEEGELTHFVAMKRDMTELSLLHRQLLQAQKLEAIGQLAAGIAHEINTPMQYVLNNVTFFEHAFADLTILLDDYQVLREAAEGVLSAAAIEHLEDIDLEFLMEEVPQSIKETQDGISRVVKIVSAMKEFSHPGTEGKIATDLNHALANTITVSRNEWKYVAELETDFDPDLPMVPCLPDQLNQAVLNLIINATHAIEETGASLDANPGHIGVSTRLDGDWVEICVSDTGCGIPEEVRERVYDPFFTTKEVGKGTGQGLTIIHDVVVQKHGGTIDFTTEMGKGTTFIIRLPLIAENAGEVV
jgi:PAS domain S-box-containing protein